MTELATRSAQLATREAASRTAWNLTATDALFLAIAFSIALGSFGEVGTPLRWLIYAMPLVAAGFAAVFAIPIDRGSMLLGLQSLSAIALALIGTTIFSNFENFLTARDSLSWAAPFLLLTFLGRVKYRHLYWLLIACLVGIAGTVATAQTALQGFDFVASTSFAETVYAFPIGCLLLVFMFEAPVKKTRNILIFICAIALIISLKRIVFAALAFSIITYYISNFRASGTRNNLFRTLLLVFSFTLCYTISMYITEIVTYLNGIFHMFSGSPETILLGREGFSTALNRQMNLTSSPLADLFGRGVGLVANQSFALWGEGETRLLHNDYLRIIYETGWFGAICVLAAFTFVGRVSALNAAIIVYCFVIFISDNTLTYVFHMAVVATALKWGIQRKSRQKTSRGEAPT